MLDPLPYLVEILFMDEASRELNELELTIVAIDEPEAEQLAERLIASLGITLPNAQYNCKGVTPDGN